MKTSKLIKRCITVSIVFFSLNTSMSIASLTNPGVPNPALVSSNDYCEYFENWNFISGKVYLPVRKGYVNNPTEDDCSQFVTNRVALYSPLVILLRGTGFDYTDYDYLLSHLAKNRMFVVSVDVLSQSDDNPASHQSAAEKAWDFVYHALWYGKNTRFYINPQAIGIIGHSRGGETARYLANLLKEEPVFNVKAIAGLAPTGDTDLFVTGEITEGYLILYGTQDPDVTPDQAYRHYDLSGNENSQLDPQWQSEGVFKAMKLLLNANHKGFLDPNPLSPINGAQRESAKGYILSFFKAHLSQNLTWYDQYIRGNFFHPDWSQATSQYSDGFYRRVIDNFDDNDLTNNTMDDTVSFSNAITASQENLSNAVDTPHVAHALAVRSANTNGRIEWSVPEGKRNTTWFKCLSLRIGQRTGETAYDLKVQIRNSGSGWSDEISLSDYDDIAQVTPMCFQGAPFATACVDEQPQAHMGTIRIPLNDFGPHDDVRNVRIRFRGDSINKDYIMDNLEFSEFILFP
jgi:dienelactone hydrolase